MTRIKKNICRKCEKTKKDSEFFLSNSLFHQESPLSKDSKNGRLDICIDCIKSWIDIDGEEALLKLLRHVDRPFLNTLWSESSGGDVGKYMRQLATLPQYSKLSYNDSDSEITRISVVDEKEQSDTDIPAEVKLFWHGYDDNDIPTLELYYQDLISSYESDTPIQKTLYKNIAATQFKADNAKTPDEFNKLIATLSKLLNDANVKPVQEIGSGDTGLSTWGEWIKKIEETEPIPEPLEEFKDPDGILKYINKWFVGHLSKIFGLSDDSEHAEVVESEISGEDNGGN